MKLFQTGGHVPETNYIFMVTIHLLLFPFCLRNVCHVLGKLQITNFAVYNCQGDFVDRGYNSLEVFTILLLLKARCILLFLFSYHGLVACEETEISCGCDIC